MLRMKQGFKSHARLAADMVGQELCVSPFHILWQRRKAEYVRARHLAWWMVSEATGWSMPRIGRLFKRNHSSIMSGLKQHLNRMDRDDEFADVAHSLLDRYRDMMGQSHPFWLTEGEALREIWENPLSAFYVR